MITMLSFLKRAGIVVSGMLGFYLTQTWWGILIGGAIGGIVFGLLETGAKELADKKVSTTSEGR